MLYFRMRDCKVVRFRPRAADQALRIQKDGGSQPVRVGRVLLRPFYRHLEPQNVAPDVDRYRVSPVVSAELPQDVRFATMEEQERRQPCHAA